MHVEVRNIRNGADCLVGTISWDGERFALEPDDSRVLQSILAEPVYDPKRRKGIHAADDPEGFLRALRYQYRSAYLRASEVKL